MRADSLRGGVVSFGALRSPLWPLVPEEPPADCSLVVRGPDILRYRSRTRSLAPPFSSPRGLTLSGLTQREADVLRLLAEGCDTAEVGRRLFYSERTVKNIIHDVTARLELRNRTHAVAYAIREGLI